MIGKKTSHYFKNIQNLPINGAQYRKSMLTIAMYTDFHLKWFKHKKKKKEAKVLLYFSLDRSSSHSNDLKLLNIKLVLFFQNSTIHPLNQG